VGETTARATPVGTTDWELVIRPRGAMLRSTAMSIVFSAVPLAVALVWVSFPLRLWAVVATVVIVVAAIVTALFVRLRTAFVGISGNRVEVRGVLSPNVRVRRSEVARTVLATTFGATIDRTTRELLALDDEGHVLFRVRSVLWDEAAVDRLADQLDAQRTVLPRPMHVREFQRAYPAARAWYERRGPVLLVGVAVMAVIAVAFAIQITGITAR
jgi:hypothetical protein